MLAIIKSLVLLYLSFNVAKAAFSTNCGKSSVAAPDWRIVGGTKAAKGDFPWQIMLNRIYVDQNTGLTMKGLCGGTIINEEWILTAAHCIGQNPKVTEYTVYLAILDMVTMFGYKAGVSKIIYHQQFQMNEALSIVKNDIALIKLNVKLNFTQYPDLAPICLANTTTALTSTCIASGYGYTAYDTLTGEGTDSTYLNYVSEPLTNSVNCEVYANFNATETVCAGGSARGGTGTCSGDSGGPLQCKGTDGKFYQVGVVSYAAPCALANAPDVYTRVSYYMPWIEDTIAKN